MIFDVFLIPTNLQKHKDMIKFPIIFDIITTMARGVAVDFYGAFEIESQTPCTPLLLCL
jgi:hypothetical protein